MYKNRRKRTNVSLESKKENCDPPKGNIPEKRSKLSTAGELLANDDEIFGSQNSIPSSQPPTQRRYLSQRFNQTQSKRRMPCSYFEVVLVSIGVDLDQNNQGTSLKVVCSAEMKSVTNSIRSILHKDDELTENIKKFSDGLQTILGSKFENAVRYLSVYDIEMVDGEIMQSQISLIGTFLMVDVIQKEVTEALLNQIGKIIMEEKGKKGNSENQLLPLMLFNLRYVPPTYGEFVYKRILDIFREADLFCKQQIISNSEYIIDAKYHNEFIEILMEDIKKEDLFKSKNLETFACLHLNKSVRKRIQRSILQLMKENVSKSIPIFTKFLLEMEVEDEDDRFQIISELRAVLGSSTECSEKEILEIFLYIKQNILISKKLFQTWEKIIRSISNDLCPLDLIVLLILITIKKEKSSQIQDLLCQRIKCGRVTSKILDKIKENFSSVFDDYLNVFLEILQNFIKDKNSIVQEFIKSSFKSLFKLNGSSQKRVINKLVELSCDKMLSDNTLPLEILADLNSLHRNDIQNYGMLLLPLLEQIEGVNLGKTRIIMDLLCSITYPMLPLEVCDSLKEHIERIVQKQIISQHIQTKCKGIIGAVQLINHAARVEETVPEENIYEIDASFQSVADLPEGRGKLVANYVVLVISATRLCPDSLAFFYEELANTFAFHHKWNSNSMNVERNFFTWFLKLITYFFENNFLIMEKSVENLEEVEVSCQRCINSPEECTEDENLIGINISGAVFKFTPESASSVKVLGPLFKLMCILHTIRYDGDLESINALLGCSLVLPKIFDSYDDVNIFEEYDSLTSKRLMDICFYVREWYKEIINGFCNQKDGSYKKKILKRLVELIELENSIHHLLLKAPSNYTSPNSSSVTGGGSNIESGKHISGASGSKRGENAMQNKWDDYGSKRNDHSKICGKMNIEVIEILKEDLCTIYPLPTAEIGEHIGILEFRFLMSDLIQKLSNIIETVPAMNTHQNIPSNKFIEITSDILPYIVKHYKNISEKILESIKGAKYVRSDPSLFTDEMNHLKICSGLCLKFFILYFLWPGLEEESQKEDNKKSGTLKRALQSFEILYPDEMTPIKEEINEMITLLTGKWLTLEDEIIDLRTAVCVYNFSCALRKHSKHYGKESLFRNYCFKMLSLHWYDHTGVIDRGTMTNSLLSELLHGAFLKLGMKQLKEILTRLPEQIGVLKTRKDTMLKFPNISKLNFPILYKELCESFTTTVNKEILTSSRKLHFWQESSECLNLLLQVVKSMDVPRNLTIFFQHSNGYIKLFVQNGLQTIENSIRKTTEEVTNLLKTLQQTTRFLHCLCCHSKVIKNTAIIGRIPALRETMEKLNFRVKAILAANGCSSAFWMGNLRNKDLQGDVILSQISSINTDNTEDDGGEDDINNDDEELEEETHQNVSNDSENPDKSTRSDCF